jgi:PEP-CTERM motif-containing protein
MKHRNGLTLAAVVLFFTACSLASTIADPGGIIRSGSDYPNYAIIEPDFTLVFGDQTITSFNIFTAGFCMTEGDGVQCNFENQSGEPINVVSQIFSSSVQDFNNAGGMTCQNDINPEAGCGTDPGNALFFPGLGIPTAILESSILRLDSINTDPDFNILYLGFTLSLGNVAGTTFSVPEPASLGLMFSGLVGLGLAWKRRARAKSR